MNAARTLRAADWPRRHPERERLLVVDRARSELADADVADLASFLRAGDLVVVNDAATLPASLLGARERDGAALEARLAGPPDDDGAWPAILFGAGDWRTRTEDRAPPPELVTGEWLRFGLPIDRGLFAGDDLRAALVRRGAGRLVWLRFDRGGAALWRALYAVGRPVQYSYVRAPLELWHVQNVFASRPWAAESPSAGRSLTFDVLASLRRRGVGLARLTHAAGLSSSGDPETDALLPLEERYELPRETLLALATTRERGGRVVAVGTTVVRALEGNAETNGDLLVGVGKTTLRLAADFEPRVVGALLTGLHEAGTSHFELLRAFAPAALLERAIEHAAAGGYVGHELGDSMLIL